MYAYVHMYVKLHVCMLYDMYVMCASIKTTTHFLFCKVVQLTKPRCIPVHTCLTFNRFSF